MKHHMNRAYPKELQNTRTKTRQGSAPQSQASRNPWLVRYGIIGPGVLLPTPKHGHELDQRGPGAFPLCIGQCTSITMIESCPCGIFARLCEGIEALRVVMDRSHSSMSPPS